MSLVCRLGSGEAILMYVLDRFLHGTFESWSIGRASALLSWEAGLLHHLEAAVSWPRPTREARKIIINEK